MKSIGPHGWVDLVDGIGTVGITARMQRDFGEIVFIELPAIGALVEKGKMVAVLESTKAAIDVYAPLSGKIIAINDRLRETPEIINQSPEKEGWLYKLRV